MNCPRCNMILAQGAQTCPNCHLGLQQYMHQYHQPGPMYGAPAVAPESHREKVYRKLLIIIAIVLMSEFLLTQLPAWFGLYSFGQLTVWLDALIWAGVPLAVALVLPKNFQGRVLLIVFAAIYILLRIYAVYWYSSMWFGMFPNDLF